VISYLAYQTSGIKWVETHEGGIQFWGDTSLPVDKAVRGRSEGVNKVTLAAN